MKNKKKLLTLPLVAALAISTVACGSGNEAASTESNGESTAAAASSEEGWNYEDGTTISLLVDTDMSDAGLVSVCDLAKDKLGINVEIEYRPGGTDGDNLIKTRLAAGEMSDICVYNSGALLSALNPSEYFADLSSDTTLVDKLDDTYKSSVTIGNAVYGVPVSSSFAGAVMYNKDLYEKYNLEVPQTWDEFMANCDVLKDAGETAVIGSFGDNWTAQVVFLGDNGNVMSQDPNFAEDLTAGTTTYSENEYALRSFEKVTDLTQYYNSDYLSTTHDDACDMLYNGEGAHWICLTRALSNMYELYGDNSNIGVFAVPSDVAGESYLTNWMPNSMYVNKNTQNYDAVMAFLEFFISDEALDAYTEALLPDGPYCVKGYNLPENAYPAVANDMQKYFDEGKTGLALEFITDIKGANCAQICQEAGSGQTTAKEAAEKYDADCRLQAQQLGYEWAQ
ncbi:MAG: carbohydrate ABC transporter substrate-binding protein [Pseudobutyrivibrio sp.]|nr:carbohydrate ABC transporter substrate-binding protein [Pseudobutyrivibrio sp.]